MKKEVVHHWNLSVKVLRGQFDKAYDYVSQNDMFVTLYLPTASARIRKTRCISNSNNVEWNETFQFRVHSQVKNILEINVYDSDSITSDDHVARILFDISTLTLGQKETKEFTADETTTDKIWVEFELTESNEPPHEYLSNGVLLAAPLSTLQVKVDKFPAQVDNLMLKLRGAYKEDQAISIAKNSSFMQTLCYHINKDLETEITIVMEEQEGSVESPVSVPFTPFAPKCDLKVCLPVAEDTVNLQLNTVDSTADGLKVRLDFDTPAAEKKFLVKRKEVVSRALQKALKLKTPLDPSQVPVVAVVFSGGSSRAMTSTFGSLKGLQKLGLLDAVTYITTVSGSTWASSTLYADPSWSKSDMDKLIAPVQKELSKSVASLFSPKQLKYYYSELRQRQTEGYPVSPIDMWGLILENLIYGKKYTATLADQQRAISEGQNPLPIYTSVNMKKDASGSMMPEWCEFTPFEVGFPKYGVFIPTEHFGSEYYLGHLVKKLPETRIPFLLGMWSSFFSANLIQLWSSFTGVVPSWTSWLGDKVNAIETDNKPSTLDTLRVDSEASTLSKLLSGRPFICSVFNFMRGLFLHNNYMENSAFSTNKDTHPDAFPNKLTPMDRHLGLVDSGLAINAGFPPVLRPQRCVDVILSFDFSWQQDHFKCLKETQQYCAEYQIPFPKIDFNKYPSKLAKEVYMFEDEEDPSAPIVLHFPRTNNSFKEYKAPGEKRTGEKELKEGDVDVTSRSSPYVTTNITFASRDFQRLVDLTAYNVLNNKETIINAIQRAVKRNVSRNRASNQ